MLKCLFGETDLIRTFGCFYLDFNYLKFDVSIKELFKFEDFVLAEGRVYLTILGGLNPLGRALPKATFYLLLEDKMAWFF